MFRLVAILYVLALVLAPIRALALPSVDVCEWAAQQAAAESGVPADILGALTLTETGRRLDGLVRPWAWSANAEGEGTWFDDPASAVAFAQDRLAQGRTNLDIGCFQLNYRWHGAHFSSPRALLDPLENARYAAGFLADLAAEHGSWELAAGAYHSRTPHLAARYRERFAQLRAGIAGEDQSPLPAARSAPRRVNTFPLLIAASEDGQSAPLASLMPGGTARASAFLPALQEHHP